MRYAVARIKQESRDMTYRIYMSECLRAICGATAHYSDLISDDVAEEKDADAIKKELIQKLGEL